MTTLLRIDASAQLEDRSLTRMLTTLFTTEFLAANPDAKVITRDIGQDPFRWVARSDIASVERPAEAVMVEREAWSVWLGVPERALDIQDGQQRVLAEGPAEVMSFYRSEHAGARDLRMEIEHLKRHELGAINERM